MTIRQKLLATYIALTGLGLSLVVGYVLWAFRGYYLQAARADLAARATAVSESVADALERGDLARVHLLVRRHSLQQRITIRVFRPDGSLFSTSAPAPDAEGHQGKALPGVAAALAGRPVGGISDVPHSLADEMWECRPMLRRGGLLGAVRFSFRLREFQANFLRIARTALGAMLATFCLCVLLSAWLARGIALPIQRMRNFAVRVGSGCFGERLEIDRRDELGQLATELNRMSERLASIDHERRAFLANVSHELRTPVSNVHVTLEALEGGADAEPDLRRRFIRTCLDETARLSRLVEDLLDLGRLEAGVLPLREDRFSLRPFLQRCARAVETRLLSSGLRLDVEVPDVELLGDQERLVQAVMNLLDNSIKHAAPDSTISVRGRIEGGWLCLELRDRGAGISEADLPHVFEQFYTGNSSRTRGGTGLGLAIARRIIEAHGGRITAAGAREQGAVFSIRLPVAPAPAIRSETPVLH